MTVVFDGYPFNISPGCEPAIEVAFAPGAGRNAADDEIAERVAADPDPASLAVVTSDAELARRVRSRGAEVVPSASFRRRLDRAVPEDG